MKSSHSPQMELLVDAPIVSMLCRLAIPTLVGATTMILTYPPSFRRTQNTGLNLHLCIQILICKCGFAAK